LIKFVWSFRRLAGPTADAGCIGFDEASIDGQSLAANQACKHAAPHHHLEHTCVRVAWPERPGAVLRQGLARLQHL
jgi:hypothetical protein